MIKNGRQEGIETGIKLGGEDKCTVIIRNMLLRGMPDTDICAIAECDADFVKKVRREEMIQ